jgi:hypothetical protein
MFIVKVTCSFPFGLGLLLLIESGGAEGSFNLIVFGHFGHFCWLVRRNFNDFTSPLATRDKILSKMQQHTNSGLTYLIMRTGEEVSFMIAGNSLAALIMSFL